MVRMNEQESRRDHLRRGPALSFFLSRGAARPATASEVIASRSVALVPVTVAVAAQTTLVEAKRASQARWRFAASCLIAASLIVAGNVMYFRSGAPYEATIRKAAEAKAAKAQQERDRATALASELATIHRAVDTTTLSNKAGREVEEPRNAAETKAAELTQKRDHTDAPANRAPPTAAPVAAPARKLNPDELAKFMDRAKRLIAAGDISPARLLLERAADAQDPTAALMLARTYDPDVLGAQNSRSINPDPTMARVWYQRAAQLGSADAQRRLSELQK
jgi:TPR repeat protein